MADLPVVQVLPQFEDRIQSDWQQQYDDAMRLCYLFQYEGTTYRAYPMDGLNHEFVQRIQRCI